jgi:REP element-mobilizing transposase RayT
MTQSEFECVPQKNGKKYFGGSLLKGNAREKRPMNKGSALHLVLRSNIAKGELSLLHPSRATKIQALVYRFANKFGVKIYRYANSGNHLHLLVRPHNRYCYSSFIKTITGMIARITLGVLRNNARRLKFWAVKPFSRIVRFGKDYSGVCAYVLQNTLEALKLVPYRPRKQIYHSSS